MAKAEDEESSADVIGAQFVIGLIVGMTLMAVFFAGYESVWAVAIWLFT